MPFEVTIDASDNVYARVMSNNPKALTDIAKAMTFAVPNAKFSPSFKTGRWDGNIRLFNFQTGDIYRGLLPNVHKILKENDYGELKIVGYKKPINHTKKFDSWCVKQIFPFVPDDYQLEAAKEIINGRRRLILSPTSSGKTFILYLAIAFLLDHDLFDNSFLFVVPRTQLVNQMAKDFVEYGMDPKYFQKLSESREVTKKIVIGTWQTIKNFTPEWFEPFDGIVIDEAHGATGESLRGIMENAKNAFYRIGVTGTLKEAKVDALVLLGLFGKVHETITTLELIEMGRIARPTIRFVTFLYDRLREEYQSVFSKRPDYKSEIKILNAITARDRKIFELLDRHPGTNRMVLFRLSSNGYRMYTTYKKLHPNEEVYYIDGNVSAEDRVRFQEAMDQDRGIVLFASSGTTSTGISIKNIDIGILAVSVKSKITILQAIGRYLRMSSTKLFAIIYDIADDLDFAGKGCYSMLHAEARYDLYAEAGFEIEDEEMYV